MLEIRSNQAIGLELLEYWPTALTLVGRLQPGCNQADMQAENLSAKRDLRRAQRSRIP